MASWRAILLVLIAISCDTTQEDGVCTTALYGAPTASTGLAGDACASQCGCNEDVWEPSRLSDATLAQLAKLPLSNPVQPLAEDPYVATPNLEPRGGVCATRLAKDGQSYELLTFDSRVAAEAEAANPTHTGACGQCSALVNLVVYAQSPDLTDPVRDCGVEAVFAGFDANVECLMELGFDEPCAQIWAYNTAHTREVCLEPCLELLDAPHHAPDGSLNACIQCDENESGPVFKAVAGRTRRNSGLPSALCRPCDSVSRISHAHWDDALRP